MRLIAAKFILLLGWKRCFAAVLLGAFGSLALPPLYLLPAGFVAFTGLVWLIDGAREAAGNARRATASGLALGWSFGFGYFVTGLYWIAEAFLVEADIYAWMIPFAVTGLPAGLALFWGVAIAAIMALWRPGAGRIFLLASGLLAAEWLRAHLLTGFPWNMPGYMLGFSTPLSQIAALAGAYGATFVTIVMMAAPALLGDEKEKSDASALMRWGTLGGVGAMIAIIWTIGALRIPHGAAGTVDGIHIRIVQPAIPQNEKWDPAQQTRIIAGYFELSDMATSPETPGMEIVTHLIWPESALPVLIEERPDVLSSIANILPDNALLMTGAVRREFAGGETRHSSTVFNSLLTLDASGDVIAKYDKWHLVPFGEYLPFEDWLRPLGFRRLVTVPSSFAAGDGPQALDLANTPVFSPLICYEAVFPGYVAPRDTRPAWLLNVTNDAWFGHSAGPHQHFAQARFRAIEEGLPLVRAANTGISAIVDPYGRSVAELGLGLRGVIDGPLPEALEPTTYVRLGDWITLSLLIAGIALSMLTTRGRRTYRDNPFH